MKANERVAAIAAYYMARFNSNLGHATATETFQRIEEVTGIKADTIKVGMRDSFDYWYPWRKGWDLNQEDKRKSWEHYGLEEVFKNGNQLSADDLKKMLMMLNIWSGTTNQQANMTFNKI